MTKIIVANRLPNLFKSCQGCLIIDEHMGKVGSRGKMLHPFQNISSEQAKRPILTDLIADDHVSVVALVRDEGVVGHGRVHGSTVLRIVRRSALNCFSKNKIYNSSQ